MIVSKVNRPPSFAIYLHWPFCLAKCPYCDFNSHVRDNVDQEAWRQAFLMEIDRAVIVDVVVDPNENCFPMIPSGAAHNEILLGPEDKAETPTSEDGMVLV